MADRRVTRTGKDRDGDIVSLCHPGMTWSPASKAAAVSDMRMGRHSYFVEEAGYRSDVHVTRDGHLRTDADASSKNNLDNLPNC